MYRGSVQRGILTYGCGQEVDLLGGTKLAKYLIKGDPKQRNIKIKMECYKYTHGCFSVFLRSSWLKINV